MYDSSYFNEQGFHLLQAGADRMHRLKFDDEYESDYDVAARIWRPDPEEAEMLVLRAWLKGHCRHLVLDCPTGVLLADGYERREGQSWKQCRTRLAAIERVS